MKTFTKTSLLLGALALAATMHAQSGPRPCDIFGAAGTPCVDAVSTTRALYAAYKGPLYEVTRASDKTTKDVGLLPEGLANAAAQDEFCAGTTCHITKLYDQSPQHNDLTLAPPGGAAKGRGPEGYDEAVVADALPVTVAGHKVYGMNFAPGMGYRNNHAKETATGTDPEGVYMLTSALHVNHWCCFDYGNAETNSLDNKHGHMDAINIKCTGKLPRNQTPTGPCLPLAGLDMEDGIPGKLPVDVDAKFATVMGANDGKKTFAIYQGDAQKGKLSSTGTIPLPDVYQPMKMEGAIILGIGGDNSNWDEGYFFEGVMTKGAPDAKAMTAVQKNIAAAKYDGDLAK